MLVPFCLFCAVRGGLVQAVRTFLHRWLVGPLFLGDASLDTPRVYLLACSVAINTGVVRGSPGSPKGFR